MGGRSSSSGMRSSSRTSSTTSNNTANVRGNGPGGSSVGNVNVFMSGGKVVQGYKLPNTATKDDMLGIARNGKFHNSGGNSRSIVIDAGNGAIQHEARITESGNEYSVMVSGKHGSFGGPTQTRKSVAAAERTARRMLEKQINSTYDYESDKYLR